MGVLSNCIFEIPLFEAGVSRSANRCANGVKNESRYVRFEALIGDLAGFFPVDCLPSTVANSPASGRLVGVAKAFGLAMPRKLRFDGVLRLPEAGDSRSKSPKTRPSF